VGILYRLKTAVEKLPEPAARLLAAAPYSWRLGPRYSQSRRELRRFASRDASTQQAWVFARLRDIAMFAYSNVPFYRWFYDRNGFRPKQLASLADWHKVPIISKGDLQAFSLQQRAGKLSGSYMTTTGGTSGRALDLYLDRGAFAREWAHMHAIWGRKGYRPSDLKLTLRGKYFDDGKPIRYNAVHNEYVVNAAVPFVTVLKAIGASRRFGEIRWIHGYPSLVAELVVLAEAHAPELLRRLRAQLKGVLLGSEFPAPVYREPISRMLSENIVSWYGHTEMSVLAEEMTPRVYRSLPTYGYAEAVAAGAEQRLVATSFHNTAHPFIRYDTEDRIQRVGGEDVSIQFRMEGGRVGDFILMRDGSQQSLTAMFFGRHHSGYELVSHLQVRQQRPGVFTLVVTPRRTDTSAEQVRNGFDFPGLDAAWDVELVSEPIRSAAGKIKLKID